MSRQTKWIYRAVIVAPAADKDAINAAVQQHLDSSGDLTLTVEATSGVYWCNSKLTRNGVFGAAGSAGLMQLAPSFPAATGYVWCDPADADRLAELEAAFAGTANVHVGEVSQQQILDNLGNE